MDKEKIFNQIAQEYKVRWAHSRGLNIDFEDVMLDPYNYAFVAVLLMDERVVLTDFADTTQIIELMPDVIQKVCKKHGITWDDCYIECEYHSNDDINRYKECLKELAELNWIELKNVKQ